MDTPSKYVHPVLAQITRGGGEMGSLIRSYNWAGSAIGPADSWPQSLRTTLSIILHSKFPMFLFWGKHLTCFYNDAYRPSLGNNGKHPSALGMPGEEVWPEIWPDIKPLLDQLLSGGEASWSEDQLLPIFRNGEVEDVYWTFSHSPVIDESGFPCAVFVTCSETTQKVKNHQVLNDSKDELAFAIDATELSVWDLDPRTNTFKGNDRLKSWFGLAPDDEIDLSNAINAIADQDRDRVGSAIQKALTYESGGSYDIEYTITNPLTNQQRIVRAKGKAWFGSDQQAYRFNGTLQDVTREVIAKKQMQQAAEKMQLAIEAANLGSYELIIGTGEVIASPAFKLHLGLSMTDTLNFTLLLSTVLPADSQALQTAVKQSIDEHNSYEIDLRIRGKDESVRWVRAAGNPVYNGKGEVDKIVGVTVDITEQKEFAEQLTRQVKDRTAELQRSNEDLLQFAHVTSHDLKEPVRKVRIFANRIQDEFRHILPEKALRYLEKIQQASGRIISMIEGVLSYSELNGAEQKVENIDLNLIVDEVRTDLEAMILEKNAEIISCQLPAIEGTGILLYQLFYNLINNSLKFSNPGQAPRIDISCQDTNSFSHVHILIADNGIGFDNAYKDQIFTTFTRLNSKDIYEGTGLGLSLCRKIAERHQGSISASAEPGKGTKIFLELPLRQNTI